MARATRNRRPSRAVDLGSAIITSPPIPQIARLETLDVPLWGLFFRMALAHGVTHRAPPRTTSDRR